MATTSALPHKPSIVLVPGSFCPPLFYTTVIDQLSANGYEAQTIDLPSIGRKQGGSGATMANDAATIQSVTSKLVDEGKDIVLVTHSYGGIPGTESVKGLVRTDREKDGKKGGVVRIVYVTSLVTPVGFSLKTLMGDTLPDFIRIEVRLAVPCVEFSSLLDRRSSFPFPCRLVNYVRPEN